MILLLLVASVVIWCKDKYVAVSFYKFIDLKYMTFFKEIWQKLWTFFTIQTFFAFLCPENQVQLGNIPLSTKLTAFQLHKCV